MRDSRPGTWWKPGGGGFFAGGVYNGGFYPAVPATGDVIPWIPITGLTLGAMDRLNNFVTDVTEISAGTYAYTTDGTKFAPATANGDLHVPIDLGISDWQTETVALAALETRIRVVAWPDDQSGNPFAMIALVNGAYTSRISGSASNRGITFHATAGTAFLQSNTLAASLSGTSSINRDNETWVDRVIPGVSSGGLHRGYSYGGTAGHYFDSVTSGLSGFLTSRITNGYNVAAGCFGAISISQRVASSVTGFTLGYDYRIVPLLSPE